MHLTPTEFERLTVFTAAEMARRNLDSGVPLSHPEAVALITDEVMLAARRDLPFHAVVDHACSLLTDAQVMPGVAEMIGQVMVDAPFAEGTKLVTVTDPIRLTSSDTSVDRVTPGEVIAGSGDVEFFVDDVIHVTVVNRGDRDIQVRSHSHFFETNRALDFDRRAAWGRKLAVTAGSGVRFEPGIPVEVSLVPFAGARVAFGFAGAVNGPLDGGATR
ncbi:urease subunit beta [Gordonia rubripertincta]|uniref:urease n=1 Tax=Gordonia rubripertincta TaxID=36822 RepID=A0AAW4G852_GORRU|nr:urease subunit beta [Gordonia rubripertincta]MBM7279284.1 urease subunit beta [Gordonia rubripertincta]